MGHHFSTAVQQIFKLRLSYLLTEIRIRCGALTIHQLTNQSNLRGSEKNNHSHNQWISKVIYQAKIIDYILIAVFPVSVLNLCKINILRGWTVDWTKKKLHILLWETMLSIFFSTFYRKIITGNNYWNYKLEIANIRNWAKISKHHWGTNAALHCIKQQMRTTLDAKPQQAAAVPPPTSLSRLGWQISWLLLLSMPATKKMMLLWGLPDPQMVIQHVAGGGPWNDAPAGHCGQVTDLWASPDPPSTSPFLRASCHRSSAILMVLDHPHPSPLRPPKSVDSQATGSVQLPSSPPSLNPLAFHWTQESPRGWGQSVKGPPLTPPPHKHTPVKGRKRGRWE